MIGLQQTSLLLLLILGVTGYAHSTVTECQQRKYDQESFVCVCNDQRCDGVRPVGNLGWNVAAVYSTGSAKGRLTRSSEVIGSKRGGAIRARIFPQKKFQRIVGFGGAITDASMLVLHKLRKRYGNKECTLCSMLQQQYYSPDGVSYTLGRVPISSCDFSDREYSYLERDQDFELESFKLSEYEYNRTAFLREAIKMTGGQLKLFASPWSAPAWMKSNGHMRGGGMLRGELNGIYYLTYARYFLRFFEEYFKEGIPFWGLTLINEPGAGLDPFWKWQAMYLSPSMQRDFVEKRLGPLLRNNWLTKDIKIMAHDDQRSGIFDAAKQIYRDEHTYIDGLAVHWYSQSSYDPLNSTHHLRPDKFILSTEACNGYGTDQHIPLLGSWKYAENYAHDIINNLLNYVTGWTDWNIWLDEFGGVNWVGNFVDAPIIVNITGAEFYKQPMYYILGHFSKFITPDSERIQIKVDGFEGRDGDVLEAVAFLTPQKTYAIVLHNRSTNQTFKVAVGVDEQPKGYVNVQMDPKSIKTVIMKV